MSREAILTRVRNAIAGSTAQPVLRDYRREGNLSPADRIAQFESRLEDYNAKVLRCSADGIADTVAKAMRERGKSSLVVPPGLPKDWQPAHGTFTTDQELSYEMLDKSEGSLTACTAAISLTGTIILTHSEMEGRRALTLIPDYHLCIVRADQLHETVPEGFHALYAHQRHPITTISGPSATSDIEMARIKGVHGPRTLDVILVRALCDQSLPQ